MDKIYYLQDGKGVEIVQRCGVCLFRRSIRMGGGWGQGEKIVLLRKSQEQGIGNGFVEKVGVV